MMLLPLLVSFQLGQSWVREPWVSGVFIAITSVLMVSRVPTPSIKYMKLQRQHRYLAGLAFAVLAGLLIAFPWATLTIGLLIYVASIPFAVFTHHPRYATKQIS
jgi:CDP-diacylglycerol--serine O-phosphatidyltransferase